MRTLILALLTAALLGPAASAVAEIPDSFRDTFLKNQGSLPDFLGVSGGVAYFAADDGRTGRELWKTDGTEGGTAQLADICPNGCSSHPLPLLAMPGGFFFLATDHDTGPRDLWFTRGDPASTIRLTERVSFPRVDTNLFRAVWDNDRKLLFFIAYDAHGGELWRSDGTPAGTWRVSNIHPLFDGPPPTNLTLFAGKVFFRAADDRRGPGLWASDGTARGTRLVKSFGLDPENFGPNGLRVVGGALLFAALRPSQGYWLWRTDGTLAETVPLTALGVREEILLMNSSLLVGPRLFFTTKAAEETPSALWVTNGTAAGTRRLARFSPEAIYLPDVSLGFRIVFSAADSTHGRELWTTDGTTVGTRLLKDFCPGPCSGDAFPILVHHKRLVIGAATPDRGSELWTTDGTAAGTRILRDVCRGPCLADPWVLGIRNGRLLFSASTADDREEIWSSDGTSQGTVQVSRFGPEGSVRRGGLYAWAIKLPNGFLFLAADPAHGEEIWRTDGTTAGTQLLYDVAMDEEAGPMP
jgi:ELWxxDGT repeat protein